MCYADLRGRKCVSCSGIQLVRKSLMPSQGPTIEVRYSVDIVKSNYSLFFKNVNISWSLTFHGCCASKHDHTDLKGNRLLSPVDGRCTDCISSKVAYNWHIHLN